MKKVASRMCIKHGSCEELQTLLQGIGEEDVDPFYEITDDRITQEDITDLQIHFDQHKYMVSTFFRN